MNNQVYHCSTPVLIVAFNRPDYLAQTFERVREAKPPRLYLAVDGARVDRDNEAERVAECQQFVKKVDWECNVYTLFRKENVGCGFGPATAIEWAFEKEDALIVLEDDCVAENSFFRFCDEMLERYKDDNRVWLISGRGHHPEYPFFKEYDYIFSHYGHTWGWATWKRCWKRFDLKMKDFPLWKALGGANNVMTTKAERRFYNKWYNSIFCNIDKVILHSWDAQWLYAYQKEGGLAIVPSKNQVHNVGVMGTHSIAKSSLLDLPSCPLHFPLRHPEYVIALSDYEKYHFNHHIKKINPNCISRAIKYLRRLVSCC